MGRRGLFQGDWDVGMDHLMGADYEERTLMTMVCLTGFCSLSV